MKVFVVSITGKPLMPTTSRRARIWLNTRRSRIVNREPFTIQLHFETADYTQPATVGVDTGSQTVGIAAINGEVVYRAEVHLRTGITGKLTHRRQYRRNRRSRKPRYRATRWANRRRRSGLLLPSLHTQAEATVKAVRFAASFLPISGVKVEIGSFDQQGELQGYLLREYLLEKWQQKCASCGAKGIPLQIEHLVPKSRGGSERASNLTLACEPCNVHKGHQTADEFGYPEIQAHARVPLRDAAHVSSIKTRVVQPLRDTFGAEQVAVTYGYETKYKRMQVLGLLKSHINDAVAITCTIGELGKPLSMLYQLRCVPPGELPDI